MPSEQASTSDTALVIRFPKFSRRSSLLSICTRLWYRVWRMSQPIWAEKIRTL